jgi:hypothetical protein
MFLKNEPLFFLNIAICDHLGLGAILVLQSLFRAAIACRPEARPAWKSTIQNVICITFVLPHGKGTSYKLDYGFKSFSMDLKKLKKTLY